MNRQKLRAFHTLLRELRVSDRTVTNINEHSGFESFESELKLLWDTFRSQIAELWFAYDRRIANDRRRSQKIEHGSIFCDHGRRIADDRRSGFPYDRRRSQNFLRSTICDSRSSAIIWKPALSNILFYIQLLGCS